MKPPRQKQEISIFSKFWLLILATGGGGGVIKFSIKRHNGKTRGVLNNHQLNYPTQVKNRVFKLLGFFFRNGVENGCSLFFPWQLQIFTLQTFIHRGKHFYKRFFFSLYRSIVWIFFPNQYLKKKQHSDPLCLVETKSSSNHIAVSNHSSF